MIQISPAVLRNASQFSDWRIYPNTLNKSCALIDIGSSFSDGTIDRRWIQYENFDSDLKEFLETLARECKSHPTWSSYGMEFYQQLDTGKIGSICLRFRVQDAGNFYAISKLTTNAVNLSDLQGMTSEVTNFILGSGMHRSGGLVIACGETRVGKSLFIAASMRERLIKYGGYCLVVSDPIEHLLGADETSCIGEKAKADYIDVSKLGYTEALPVILRSFPLGLRGSLIFGEIRSDLNAFDLIKTANNGHLIFTTIHASSPDSAIDRLVAGCSQNNVSPELVRSILASSLQGITYHNYSNGKFSITPYPATEETKKLIRQGHPLPFKSSKQFTV